MKDLPVISSDTLESPHSFVARYSSMVPSKNKQSFFVRRRCGWGSISSLWGRWLLGGRGPSGGRLRGLLLLLLPSVAGLGGNVGRGRRLRGGRVRIVRPSLLLLKADWLVHYPVATDDCLWSGFSAWLGGWCRLIGLGGHLRGSFGGHAWTSMGGRLSSVITGPHAINAEVSGALSIISIWVKKVRRVVKLSSQLLLLFLLFVLLTYFIKMFLQPQANQFTGTLLQR